MLVERTNSPTAAGNGRCQQMQHPSNPMQRNCNEWRQFGAVTWFGLFGDLLSITHPSV
jgi:hypothetical protein